MKYKKFLKTREEKEWVQDETIELNRYVAFVYDQGAGKFVGFERNIRDVKNKIIALKGDTRNYSKFSKEESGVWTYIPRNTTIREKIYLIGRQENFYREGLDEQVNLYYGECQRTLDKRKKDAT